MTSPLSTVSAPSAVSGTHPLDQALHGQWLADGSFQGRTHAGYGNMVGPYGGVTAAQMLQAVLQHPQREGQPLSLTVQFARPVQDGAWFIFAEPVCTNRSTQHWQIRMSQRDAQGHLQLCTLGTAVTATRRSAFGVDDVERPAMPDPETCERYAPPVHGVEWLRRYDMRVVQGGLPEHWDDSLHDSITQLWARDDPPRPLDFVALTALCDVFFPRIWLRRARQVPAGTVSMTVYFHADQEQLDRHADQHVLAQSQSQVFRDGYFDHVAQLWDREGDLLATSHQIVYYKD